MNLSEPYYESLSGVPARRMGWRNALERHVRFEVVRHLIKTHESLLDLGAGDVQLGRHLRACGWKGRYIAVESFSHPWTDFENAELIRRDFREISLPDADLVVAIGTMVGNTEATPHQHLLSRLEESRRAAVFIALDEEAWAFRLRDPALSGVMPGQVEMRKQADGRSWYPISLFWDELAFVLDSQTITWSRREMFRRADELTPSTVGERANVASSLDLEDILSGLNQAYPQDPEVSLAVQRWQNRHKIRLA